MNPRVVEIQLTESCVRGHVWPRDANWVVLVHAPGGDLDAWGRVPKEIAADGYSVLAVDLPGHGLSDDPWNPDETRVFLATLVRFANDAGAAKVFILAAREMATAAMRIEGVDGLVALSPQPFAIPPADGTPPVLILTGGADHRAVAASNAFFRQIKGWAVASSLGTELQGTAIFQSPWAGHALEQTLAFLRDYRTAAPQ